MYGTSEPMACVPEVRILALEAGGLTFALRVLSACRAFGLRIEAIIGNAMMI